MEKKKELLLYVREKQESTEVSYIKQQQETPGQEWKKSSCIKLFCCLLGSYFFI